MEEQLGSFKVINSKISFIHQNGWAIIVHATFNKRQPRLINWRLLSRHGTSFKGSEVADRELIKLWPHRTRKKHFAEYQTEPMLKVELEHRGYTLTSHGKWVKAEIYVN